MSAATMDIALEQGATLLMQFKFETEGTPTPIDHYDFIGSIKASVYDEQDFSFRFEFIDVYTVNVYMDADISEDMDFKKGVYDIKMIHKLTGDNVRLLEGAITVSLGVTDATSIN